MKHLNLLGAVVMLFFGTTSVFAANVATESQDTMAFISASTEKTYAIEQPDNMLLHHTHVNVTPFHSEMAAPHSDSKPLEPKKSVKPSKTKASKLCHCQPQCDKSKSNKPKRRSPWHGSQLSLGLIINTGNTDSSNINAGAIVNYSKKSWNNNAQINAQWGRDNGELSKEKYFLQDQLNYLFNGRKRNFIFANTTGTVDEFSPYLYQVVFTTGYGRELIKSKHFYLRVQLGPGYRHNQQKATSELPSQQDNSMVASGQAQMAIYITHSGKFTEELRYDYGSPYNYLRSVTAFTNKIIHNLAVQISFIVDNYSTIPPGSTRSKKTDTTTSLSLVYNF